jgi:predicted GNAT superfamily acetyltransferase
MDRRRPAADGDGKPPRGGPSIRPLDTPADYAACVELQELVWGRGNETIPPIMLQVSQKVGAVAAGAFDEAGRMLGCVFGLTGLRQGRPAHWSHMLAVRPEARGLHLGRRLKHYQRRRVLALGVRTMYWSFDPLVARNAYLNLVVLGATVEEYVTDMYGPGTGSPVDRGIGTDRLIVRWNLERRPRRPLPRRARRAQVEIPEDIHGLRDRHPEEARAWRDRTREAFQDYLRQGFRVRLFHRAREHRPPFYTLVKT